MSFDRSEWIRIIHNDTPVYVRPNSTDWFVPNKKADDLLTGMDTDPLKKPDDNAIRFLERLPDKVTEKYQGRSKLLEKPILRELWFHLTDRCNMACTHCLFSSKPSSGRELRTEKILKLINEADDAGCKVFALTGGEPFVHPGLDRILSRIMAIKNSHIVILSNGMETGQFLKSKKWDSTRLHLQISVDGIGTTHDQIRGKGMFDRLKSNLSELKALSIPFTISMCVTRSNVKQMSDVVNFAAENGASNVHFMWYFIRGRAKSEEFIPASSIMDHLLRAEKIAADNGITIDNIEAIKSMIFAPCGTIHDGSTAGWESVAVGPDGLLYPSAATVSIPALATPIESGLMDALKKSSILESIRQTTAVELSSPLKLFLGGGDMDHSYMHKGTFSGDDPYAKLNESIALELITRKSKESPDGESPRLLLKMGDVLSRCSDHGAVALTHNNCLLAVAGNDSLSVVKDFYTRAAETSNEDILNPVCYSENVIAHIPEKFRFRGYGCGSPVLDAGIKEGENIADLGSGRGIECFIAAKMTGKKGHVIGIDMLTPMLEHAENGHKAVATELGYDNMEFRKGYLEQMPLENDCMDLILSNCVLNLSTDKRRTFSEIFRVLKPGGRITVSDVVCDSEPGAAIRNDETLNGECIAGALTVKNLTGLLTESGFEGFSIIKRFPYRKVGGQQFYSMTFSAIKPEPSITVKAIYRGPFVSARMPDGTLIVPGKIQNMPESFAKSLGTQVFIIDDNNNVSNIDIGSSCCCPTPKDFDNSISAEVQEKCCVPAKEEQSAEVPDREKNITGCLLCGAELEYTTTTQKRTCVYCNKEFETNAHCINGHFVCDTCHSKDALLIIPRILIGSTETDMIELLLKTRNHPSIPIHGPEHHALVPAVITAAYRNSGGKIPDEAIISAMTRGSKIAGGYCGFMGICGAAIGVGIAISTILEATPYTAEARSAAQKGTLAALSSISELKAARCCQRDSWLALKACSRISSEILGIKLKSEVDIHCTQMKLNKECMGRDCPVIKNTAQQKQPKRIKQAEISGLNAAIVKKS